jgi:hypothetical protein
MNDVWTDVWLPTDVSDQERELGFELIQIFVPDGYCQKSFFIGWVYVVAKVIRDSDILVKKNFGDGVVYQHERFGRHEYEFQFKTSKDEWKHYGNGFQRDIKQAISDAFLESNRDEKMIGIVPAKAEIRKSKN